MKKTLLISLPLLFLCYMLLFAQGITETKKSSLKKALTIEIKGIIIDNLCAASNNENLPAFIKTHTKECALMPSCQASGYSIYTQNGQLIKFDIGSNKKIIKFLKKPANKLEVIIEAKKIGEELNLISIKNLNNSGSIKK
ncbi:MAG: hypothetical protein A2539_10585 [Elusimicrobia bacterium RIFOXYD2_FULL_34_15]|nr:MAG: hypothetical protein A2539_10585 [Elusimicrobia bacterium RIFOXYD2_FULL_34_15]